jgi:hypothetical protein
VGITKFIAIVGINEHKRGKNDEEYWEAQAQPVYRKEHL